MTEKLVCDDYEIEGVTYKLWTETELRECNFKLTFGGIEQDLSQFSPRQIQSIADYVEDWRAPGGH